MVLNEEEYFNIHLEYVAKLIMSVENFSCSCFNDTCIQNRKVTYTAINEENIILKSYPIDIEIPGSGLNFNTSNAYYKGN